MKKKMLFMAAIAGLISLGSCVKDDVSGSVEAVRNAKANELNAKANEHNAQAAVYTADAALKNAVQSAEVAIKQAEAALKAAEAEAKQLDTQLQKERYAAQLESVVSGFEATTAANKLAAQLSANQLADALYAASDQEMMRINELIDRFNSAYTIFTSAQSELINAQAKLAQAKVGKEFAEAKVADAIQAELNKIAENKAILEALKEIDETGTTSEEKNAQLAAKRAELLNAISSFDNNSEAIQAFVAAAKDLVGLNAAVEAFVNPYVTGDYDGDGTPGTTADYAEAQKSFAGFTLVNEMINPHADSGETPVFASNYFVAKAGETETIVGDIAFVDYGGFRVSNTGTTAVPALSAVPVMPATPKLNKLSFTIDQYRVDELVKNEADKYFANLPETAKATLDADKAKLDELVAKMGTDKDTEKTEYDQTQPDGTKKKAKTDYANLKQAEKDLATAKTNFDKAEGNKKTLPAAVKSAYKDMWNVYDKISSDDEAKATALYKFAKAVETAYGTTKYNHLPANMDLALAADRNEVINYMLGASGHNYATENWDKVATIKTLVIAGSPLLDGTLLASFPATFDDTALDNLFEGVTGALATTRKTGAESCIITYNKAKAALGDPSDVAGTPQSGPNADTTKETAYAKVQSMKEAIFGKYNAAGTLIANGTTQDIAVQKNKIAKTSQPDYDNAAAKKAAYEAAVEAADFEKYDAAVKDLKDGIDAYYAAYAAVLAEVQPLVALNNEITAISQISVENVDDQIAAAEAAIATAEENLAKAQYAKSLASASKTAGPGTTNVSIWDPTAIAGFNPVTGDPIYGAFTTVAMDLTYDELIEIYENAVQNAETKLAAAAAELALATKALEAYEIDLDGDEEPAEEPSEEPAEEPAEGGEETPAEGEGEAEGGEEA